MANLGRFRMGDVVTIAVATSGVPDNAPVGVILNASSYSVFAAMMPTKGPTLLSFALEVFVGSQFSVGNYSVSYQFSISGTPVTGPGDTFVVVPGGDSGGSVISLYSFNRPEANYVVAQLNSGRLAQGLNPSL